MVAEHEQQASVNVPVGKSLEVDRFLTMIGPWQSSVFRIMGRILGNQHDAEDAWQSLVLRLWESSEKLPDVCNFPAWIRRCAVNEAIRRLRQKRPEVGLEAVCQIAKSNGMPCEELAELRETLAKALQTTEPTERALLSLRFDEGLTIREIAEVLERPPATVHAQLDRAIDRLRKSLATQILEQKTP